MPKQSAGILLYRKYEGDVQVFLVHPGGPFFKNKDAGVWSIPKGEFLQDEEALEAAKREFWEETGQSVDGPFKSLGTVTLKSGKTIYAWALEGEINPETIVSNSFEIEWPPRSGKQQAFPEIDRAAWFTVAEARIRINEAQAQLLDNLAVEIW